MAQYTRGPGIAAVVLLSLSLGALASCEQRGDEPAADSTAGAESALSTTAAPAPRLVSPLSTSISTSQSPVFRWAGGGRDGVIVEVCSDRACTHKIAKFDAEGSSARPPMPLPPGVVFWRVSNRRHKKHERSATWELTIPARDSGRTGFWGSVPDFNGDGFGDLAVSTKVAKPQVRIFPGGPSGPAATPAQTLLGPPGFGDEMGPVGDLDGDGFCELAIWTSGPPITVTVYRGGPQGLSSPVMLRAPDAPAFNQMRVVSAGDVNGDGYGDLLVGGREAELFLGGPRGVSRTPAQKFPAAPSPMPDARWPMGGADFNGDGFPDAVISGINGPALYDGNGKTLVAHPGASFPSSFGAVAGDFNGDGFADVAIYASQVGGPNGPVNFFQAIAGAYHYQGVGDVNGDGFSDALVMVSSLLGVLEAERLYFGGLTPCTSTACSTFVPLFVPGHLNDGNGLPAVVPGGLGDVNGDGFGDFAYASPGTAAVYLFYGAAAGPPTHPSVTITAEPGFGFSLARL